VVINHFAVKVIEHSGGRSAVAAAAHRGVEELYDERLAQSRSFIHKAGLVHSELLLPKGALERLLDRTTLW
jgi:hypothetical protein